MGCLGLYYHLYDDGSLMLYTEREFNEALADYGSSTPVPEALECVVRYCAKRDSRR